MQGIPVPSWAIQDQQGVTRCNRVIETAVARNPKNPAEGFIHTKAYCRKPVTLSVSDGGFVCPDCNKKPPVGNVHPRVTNSAGTALTAAELKECGLTEDPSLNPVPTVKKRAERKPREAKPAVEAKVKKEVKKDTVTLEVPLSLLETDGDVAATLIKKTMEAFGSLPVTNYAESKRLMLLEEKLKSLLEA